MHGVEYRNPYHRLVAKLFDYIGLLHRRAIQQSTADMCNEYHLDVHTYEASTHVVGIHTGLTVDRSVAAASIVSVFVSVHRERCVPLW